MVMRLPIIVLMLAFLIIIPFVIWGEWFELALDGERAIEWLRSFGWLTAPVAIALLAADILLPLPASGIMAALGVLFGPIMGGVIAALGNWLSGAIAFVVCRRIGRPAMQRIAGGEALKIDEARFKRFGVFFVAGSRALPVLPEITACLAGLYAMPWSRFVYALSLGALLTGFGFAYLGHAGRADPFMVVIIATMLPPLALLLIYRFGRHVPLIDR